MASRSRLFSKIAKDVGSDGNLTAAALSSDVSFGATVYDSTGVLPYVGNDTGDQAYVKSTNRFYIWDSAGWYNVALINRAPTISSVLDSDGASSPFALSTDGTATTITITATDSDGDPITYTATTDANFNGLATVTGSGNEFTITPFSSDSATTESGTITFKATDGINISSSISTFTLNFLSSYWDKTVLSIGTSSTNNLDNDTFIDRSTNAHTVTASGTPTQTAFHPYLDNWSVEFDGTDDHLLLTATDDYRFLTGDFTVEAWICINSFADYFNIWQNTFVTSTAGSDKYFFGVSTNGSINFYRHANGGGFAAAAGTIELGKWHHVAFTRDTTSARIYVDGTNVAETTNAAIVGFNISAQDNHTVGYRVTPNWAEGFISNLRVVKGTAVYTANFTPATENLTAIANTVLLTCQSNRFIDNGPNSNTITATGGPQISAFNPFGQSEYAVGENKGATYFNKTNYLTYPQNNDWIFGTDDVTMEAWVYPIGTQGDQYTSRGLIYGKAAAGGAYWFNEVFAVSTTDLIFTTNNYTGNSNSATVNASNVIKTEQWNHVVFTQYTIVGTRYWSLYCNGVREYHSNTTANLSISTTGWTHHTGFYPGDAISFDYNGYISDLKISKSALYTSSSYTIPTSPLGNTSAYLYAPMDNAGIFNKTGLNTLTLFGNASTSTAQTKFADTAVYFDGTGDYVSITDMPTFGTNDFTVEGWIYIVTGGSNRNIFDARNGSSNSWVIQSTNFEIKIYDEVATSYIHETTGGVETSSINSWIHVAYCRSGSTSRFFINGNKIGNDVSNSSNFQNNSLTIGARYTKDQQYFDGYIENFQVLKGVAKYTANFTPPTQEQGRTYQTTS